jgi:hypothetical protein
MRRAAKSSRGGPADIPHIRPPIRSFASSAAGDGTGGGGLGARSARLRGIGVLGKDFLASASARKSVDRRDVGGSRGGGGVSARRSGHVGAVTAAQVNLTPRRWKFVF